MAGFFSLSVLQEKRDQGSGLPLCGSCGLYKKCQSPKMPITGKGKRGVFVLGEAPGQHEDEQGVPFVGKAGQHLRSTLKELDVSLMQDCWVGNSLICRPPKNATPTELQIGYCRPNVFRAIQELQPRTIILLGGFAIRSVIGKLWKDDSECGAMRWAGFQIPNQEPNAWICPTFHPSYVKRELDDKKNTVPQLWFKRHLKAAFQLEGRPWNEVPDYRKQVDVLFKEELACEEIEKFSKSDVPVAFDYETDRLKPDREDASIICCAMSNGTHTISFPWTKKTKRACGKFLRSDVPKIAHNLKFEDRWTRRMLGHGVNKWLWDPMLYAHWDDNRPGITGLKFQSFVKLGQGSYDHHIKPFLKNKDDDPNGPNRIREVDQRQLMLYCGLDALLTWKLADLQMKDHSP